MLGSFQLYMIFKVNLLTKYTKWSKFCIEAPDLIQNKKHVTMFQSM